MKSSQQPPEKRIDGSAELARVRAEVASALNHETPNEALLRATLERVEQLLDEARGELVAAVREIRAQVDIEQPASESDVSPETYQFRGCGFLPW